MQGLCAIYMPDFVAQKINISRKTKDVLVEYPLPKNQKNLRRMFLLRHKDQAENAAFEQLYKMMKEVISS